MCIYEYDADLSHLEKEPVQVSELVYQQLFEIQNNSSSWYPYKIIRKVLFIF